MMRRALYNVWEILEIVIIAVVTVFLIRAFIVQPFLVSGASMEIAFLDGDYVLVDEITYRFKQPERGDVIVFRYPLNPKLFYIKRVIGTDGEKVVVAGGDIFVGDSKLNENYLRPGTRTFGDGGSVATDELFVMGDNRNHSFDSRNWGIVPFDNIIGVVRTRLLPVARAQVIERPEY